MRRARDLVDPEVRADDHEAWFAVLVTVAVVLVAGIAMLGLLA